MIRARNVTFSDAAISRCRNRRDILTGTYKPSNCPMPHRAATSYPAPAPAGPLGDVLIFTGLHPTDVSLYVVDDGRATRARLPGGWTLSVTTANISISDITDQITLINTPTGAIPFTVSDADTPLNSLTLSKSSNNTALVPPRTSCLAGVERTGP